MFTTMTECIKNLANHDYYGVDTKEAELAINTVSLARIADALERIAEAMENRSEAEADNE